MNHREYERLYQFEDTYWWHIGRRSIVRRLLHHYLGDKTPLRILDVGCGTGGMLPLLGAFGGVTGVDHSDEAIKFCQRRGSGAVKLGDAESLPFAPESFDLVTMFDLLEHVEDDPQALKETFRVLKRDGYLLLTVPAYPFLWSGHDEALGHWRRYRVRDLRLKIYEAGFEIEKMSFTVSALLPPIIFYRLLQRVFAKRGLPKTSYVVLPMWLNGLLAKVLAWEGWLMQRVSLPFGASIVCLAKKRVGAQ